MIRVVAPNRLHFGLFNVPTHDGELPPGERAFGGVGLMTDTPGVEVTAKPAKLWKFKGPLAARAEAFARRFVESMPEGSSTMPFKIRVVCSPVEHAGLGVGTQLGLAVGKALAVAMGQPHIDSVTLAHRVGRGERSAIGVHGFDHGGLLIDRGKAAGEAVAPLAAHVRLPKAWRVVLFLPDVPGEWHGQRERQAFANATRTDPASLQRIAETGILPAARAGDLDSFGEAVYEFNRKAGEPFAAAQGGTYASPAIAELITEVRSMGVRGVGQSSWGPTVFAIVGNEDIAQTLLMQFGLKVPTMIAQVSSGHITTIE